jgi:hypothetical protein
MTASDDTIQDSVKKQMYMHINHKNTSDILTSSVMDACGTTGLKTFNKFDLSSADANKLLKMLRKAS